MAANVTTTLASCNSEDESIALSLVQDLLECLNLTYTNSVLQAELKHKYNRWPRRRIADLLQLDLDETSTAEADASLANASKSLPSTQQSKDKDTSTDTQQQQREEDLGSRTVEEGNRTVCSEEISTKTADASSSPVPTTANGMTPLLVEILRRLSKTTDESTTKDDEDDADDDETFEKSADGHSESAATDAADPINDTYVTQCRSANQTSESL